MNIKKIIGAGFILLGTGMVICGVLSIINAGKDPQIDDVSANIPVLVIFAVICGLTLSSLWPD